MSQVAIFTAPKPFTNSHIAIIQHNAIQSWKLLGEDVDIWLVGNEEGVEKKARELKVGYLPDVQRNDSGTPCIDSIFDLVRQKSNAHYLCYVNADILLFPDLLETLEIVVRQSQKFLLVGQRWDIKIEEKLDIKPGWETAFLERLKKEGKLHAPAGSDYFIFPRELYRDIPQFAVGRSGWDNWMIYHGRREGFDVINATGSLTAGHQDHDFSHLPGGKIHRRQPESLDNLQLAGGRHTMFTLRDANKIIESSKVVSPAFSWNRLWREATIFPTLKFKTPALVKLAYVLFNPRKAYKEHKKTVWIKKSAQEKK